MPPPAADSPSSHHHLPSLLGSSSSPRSRSRSVSPVAPEYSPITPKVLPVLPAVDSRPPLPPSGPEGCYAVPDASHQGAMETGPQQQGPARVSDPAQQAAQQQQRLQHQQQQHQPQPQPPMTIPPASYIPNPPPQPFSSGDSSDAIALRAAIASLQFQKKKAQDDLQSLDRLRGAALDDPARFRTELAAGRLREQRPSVEAWRAVLDGEDSGDEDGDEDGDGEAASEERASDPAADGKADVEMHDGIGTSERESHATAPFARIPGPQNVVRMPHVNWEKYHIVGEGLDRLHELQRRWPGSTFAYDGAAGRGREHVVAAPYSPWLDTLDDGGVGSAAARKRSDSVAVPASAVSEHPMETRRGSRLH